MDASLAARLPFEVFDRISHVRFGSLNASLCQGAVEQLARGTDERLPLDVFFVPRLLSDKHDASALRAFSKNRLRTPQVQVASFARMRRFSKRCQIQDLWHEVRGRVIQFACGHSYLDAPYTAGFSAGSLYILSCRYNLKRRVPAMHSENNDASAAVKSACCSRNMRSRPALLDVCSSPAA